MDKVGVPKEHQGFKEKWRIALEPLDECVKDIDATTLLFDAGYGGNRVFLKELDQREVKFVGGLKGDETLWDANAALVSTLKKTGGRPRKHVIPEDAKALTTKHWADKLFAQKANIKKTEIPHNTPISVEFAAVRLLEVGRLPRQHIGPERWLILLR